MNDIRSVRGLLRAFNFAPVSWADRYAALFTLAMLGLLLAQPVTDLFESLGRADPSRLGAGVALLALGYAGYLAAARTLGPVALPAADAAWLLLSPLPRRGVLRRTAVILLAVSLLAGAALGLGMLAVLGVPDRLAPRLAIAMALAIAAAVGGMATAVLAQASSSWDSLLQGAITAAVLAAVIAALLGAGSGRHLLVTLANAPPSFGAGLAAACAALSAFLAGRAWTALERIHARDLIAASTRFSGVANAVTALDPSALTWIAEDRHWRGRTLRSRPWPVRRAAKPTPRPSTRPAPADHNRRPATTRGTDSPTAPPLHGQRWSALLNPLSARFAPARHNRRPTVLETDTPPAPPLHSQRWSALLGPVSARLPLTRHNRRPAVLGTGSLAASFALAWHDWRRLARRPGRQAVLFGAAVLPALAAQAGGGVSPIVLAVLVGGALAAAASCCAGERRDADDPALARLLGVGHRSALAARALLPALVSAAWLALALAALTVLGILPAGRWWLFAPLAAPALAAGALRMARRQPIEHAMPVLDVMGGMLPLGPLVWALTGVDVAVLGCAPLLYAVAVPSPSLGAGLATQAVTGAAALLLFLLFARRRS